MTSNPNLQKQLYTAHATVQIDAHVTIGVLASGGFGLAVVLTATLPDLERTQAEALVAAAHEVCPYSNATRGNIQVDLKVAS